MEVRSDSQPPRARFLFVNDLLPRLKQEVLSPPQGVQLLSWNKFNEYTGGMRMHELSLMTSDTGTGKTTFLANLATQVLLQGHGIYVASVEIGAVAFLLAMISVLAQKDYNTGERFTEQDWARIEREWIPLLLKGGRIVFANHDSKVSPKILCDEMEEANQKWGTKFAILDNFQFFSTVTSADSALMEQDQNIRFFVDHAKRVPMHQFLIVHCRKTQNDNGRVDSLSDMKGSKTLADEAANVFALNRPTTEAIGKGTAYSTDREVKFLKLRRRGKNVGRYVRFYYDDGLYGEIRAEHDRKALAAGDKQLEIGL